MVGVVIASHGRLAEELVAAAQAIVGPLPQLATVCLSGRPRDELCPLLSAAVDQVDTGEGALVLVDLFGGSPSQAACSLLDSKHVEVVSGVNLPMVIKLATARMASGPSVRELAQLLTAYGQKNVVLASELVRAAVRQGS